MFETLSDRFNNAFRNLSGRGTITEDNVREVMQEEFICFDPADLEESHLPVLARKAVERREDFVEAVTGKETVRLSLQ